jgi:hypothetical protein
MRTLLTLVATIATLVNYTLQKIVIPTYKQQIVLLDQVPIVNTAMVIKNDGTNNVQDFQLIFPTKQLELLGHIDIEDGFGNKIEWE